MWPFSKSTPTGTKATLYIVGMHCTSCSLTIDATLEETPGVISATTSYAKAKTEVIFDPKQVTQRKLIQAVKTLGYDVKAEE